MTLIPGSRLGRYEIVELLGAGGMGVVYRARDAELQRDVAIKVLPPGVLTDEHARRLFRREALALAKLNHPNIATVYDVGADDGNAYLVMECVAGESLAERLRRGRLSVAEALTFTVQIAGALQEAHEHGVIHRDLKPANVMITPKGTAKVLDFGLAKLLAPGDAVAHSRTDIGSVAGTPLYMSPEQAFGDEVDHRTDLWSLGVVVYESLAGQLPFLGKTDFALMRALSEEEPPALRTVRPDVPAAVEQLVTHAMTRDRASRYQTAESLGDDARGILATLSQPAALPRTTVSRNSLRAAVFVAVVLMVMVGAGIWFTLRSTKHNWATQRALPIATMLYDSDYPLAAFDTLHKAIALAPDDTMLTRYLASVSRSVSVASSPAGANVAILDYLATDSVWHTLGITPLDSVTIPKGYFRWRITPTNGAPLIVAPVVNARMTFNLDSAARAGAGAVRVGANSYQTYIAFIGWVGPYALPAFDIDRFEVTNAEYQEFVDADGYRTHKYWTAPFDDHGVTLTWDSAQTRFRDQSGRPGPATWISGHFPDGKGAYPVGGISWYEASAYAEFRSKQLPTMAQWHEAAPPDITRWISKRSNLSNTESAPVGRFSGIGPYGTYDMAGNVREWVMNANDAGGRFILGGAWQSSPYLYEESETLPPFDRSPVNGLRTVRNLGPLPVAATQAVRMLHRDFAKLVPASDAVFAAYRVMYTYDAAPLHTKSEGIVEQNADWRVEKVSFDAAYSGERMSAFLYVPTHVKPPYQTVVFFPSANVLFLKDSHTLGDVGDFDYIVQSGRAVLYPIFQDTYERRLKHTMPGASHDLELTTERSKDLGRSLDYLQSRSDIASDHVAYLGVSMGAAEGVIYATIAQQRLRTAVLLDGGFFLAQPSPGADAADFAPRLKIPVLMVNGRFDATFAYNESQLPLLHALGTPISDKAHVVLQTSHDVTSERTKLVYSVLTWLDKYLGRIE